MRKIGVFSVLIVTMLFLVTGCGGNDSKNDNQVNGPDNMPAGVSTLLANFRKSFLDRNASLIATLADYPVEEIYEIQGSTPLILTWQDPASYQAEYNNTFKIEKYPEFTYSNISYQKISDTAGVVDFNIKLTVTGGGITASTIIHCIAKVKQVEGTWKYNSMTFIIPSSSNLNQMKLFNLQNNTNQRN
ncbi:MAG TPA: hypothetical protein VIM29_11615 [Bacillota bacterium]